MEFECLQFEVADQVATITLNRPERYNALNPILRQNILDAVQLCERQEDIRTVIITGAGKAFCSGGDMKEMMEAAEKGETNPLSNKLSPIRDEIILAIRGSTKPYIAAVNGAAAGGGMGIALACDIRVASTAAWFGQTFSKRGMHPDWGGTYFLPRLIGTAKACELIWSGRMIDAEEALQLGLVSQVLEPEELISGVGDMALTFASGPPIAIRLSKRAIYRNLEAGLREALEFETYAQNICVETEDVREGVTAFLEKREPKFKGQ